MSRATRKPTRALVLSTGDGARHELRVRLGAGGLHAVADAEARVGAASSGALAAEAYVPARRGELPPVLQAV